MAFDEFTLARLRKEREESIKHFAQADSVFLCAWIKGVTVIGEGWFTHNPTFCQPAPNLDHINNKWQVIPNYELINQKIGVLSGGEAALLAAMCSFYNAEWGGKLMNDIGIYGMADVSAKLDLNSRRIIADLMLNYTGW
jgi:hypothetical protein